VCASVRRRCGHTLGTSSDEYAQLDHESHRRRGHECKRHCSRSRCSLDSNKRNPRSRSASSHHGDHGGMAKAGFRAGVRGSMAGQFGRAGNRTAIWASKLRCADERRRAQASAGWMASQAWQIKRISAANTIAQTRSMGCGSDIRPLSAIVRRFCYNDRMRLTHCYDSTRVDSEGSYSSARWSAL